MAIGTGSITANDGSVTIASGSASTTATVAANVTAGNGNLTISNAGTGITTVSGKLTTLNGNLNITDSNNAGGIDLGNTASITNGNVTIQNTNNANGTITLEANTTIHASATAPNLGNVTVADGTFTSSVLTAQTPPPPANVTYNFQPGGAIYFATTGPAGQPDFASAGNVLNANGRAVTLFVGGGATSTGKIILNGDVTLTADPPPVTTGTSAVQSANSANLSNSLAASSHLTGTTGAETVAASFSTVGASGITASLSPVSGILNGTNGALGYQGSGLGAIQSSTLASVNRFDQRLLGCCCQLCRRPGKDNKFDARGRKRSAGIDRLGRQNKDCAVRCCHRSPPQIWCKRKGRPGSQTTALWCAFARRRSGHDI